VQPREIARLVPPVIAALVSLVSLRMAVKGLGARRWLRFHEAAAGTAWDTLDERLRRLLLFLVRMGGLGFLAVSLLLALVSAEAALGWDRKAEFAPLAIGVVFCSGLGLLNQSLHRATGAVTPFKQSFLAAGALAVAAILSIVS
jgi:hypothetical protein